MDEANDQKPVSYGKRPLWQWAVIYIIIGAVIYAGIYYFFLAKKDYNQPVVQQQTSSETTQASQSAQIQNEITLTVDGFSPVTLTVKSGTTVSWINKSNKAATVNSDPHPIHTDYPPLNLGNFPDNGTLSLIFDKPGTYGYHNHLNPQDQGTIVVE